MATTVDFHSGVPDAMAYACRLVRKAWRSQKSILVTGTSSYLGRLDAMLWTFDPGEFLPHARWRRGEPIGARLQRAPVVLTDTPAEWMAQGNPVDVLINLGPEASAAMDQAPRVIEIVAADAQAVASGRARWRHCREQGLTPVNHAVGASASDS